MGHMSKRAESTSCKIQIESLYDGRSDIFKPLSLIISGFDQLFEK